VAAANLVTSDPLLALWETLGAFAFVSLWWSRPPPAWAATLMWTAFGLAFLTKGPPGLLPLAAILVFAGWTGGLGGLRRLVSSTGFGVFLLVGLGWFALQVIVRPDLLPYLLGDEVAGRVAGVHLRNPGWWGLAEAYSPVLILGLFPWVLVAWRGPMPSPEATRFLLLWLLGPLLVFFVAQSRLPLYLLPLTVPAALLVGRRLAGRRPRWAGPALATWVIALLALEAFAAVHADPRDGRRFARQLAGLLPEVPNEVVFVDEKPRWSLEVYLGCKVEAVEVLEDLSGRGGPAYRPLVETLPGELGELEEGAVYLVPPGSLPSWRGELGRRGWRTSRLGRVGGFEVFATAPPGGDAR
jgi:4-amino-4-deoxy-L-arabinose transferase